MILKKIHSFLDKNGVYRDLNLRKAYIKIRKKLHPTEPANTMFSYFKNSKPMGRYSKKKSRFRIIYKNSVDFISGILFTGMPAFIYISFFFSRSREK